MGPQLSFTERLPSAEGKRAKIVLFFAINDLESMKPSRP